MRRSRRRRCRSTTRRCPDQRMIEHAERAWDRALSLGEQHGYRNAQVSVIAPTGTIGLVMDCDTTGIEPDFALVKFKKLAGGGYFKIINRAVPRGVARARLFAGADRRDRDLCGRPRQPRGGARHQSCHACKQKGFTPEAIEKVEKALPTAFDIKFVFNKWTLGEDFMAKLGIARRKARRSALRSALGARLHQARDRGRQRPCLRRDDGRRRSASQAPSTIRCSTAPIRAAETASAISRSRATSA